MISNIGRSFIRGTYKFSPSLVSSNIKRSLGSDSAAYEGDGRTTVQVLNNEEPHLNFVNTYSAEGFRLSNNLFINGSIVLFPTHVYSWNIRRGKDINRDSLLVFDLIVPKVKILIIGYGDSDEPYDASLSTMMKRKGISCEMLPTPNAVTTYNYLVHDSVHVAGAFVPVRQPVKMETRDLVGLYEYDNVHGEHEWLPDKGERDPIEYYKEKKKELNKDKDKKTFDE